MSAIGEYIHRKRSNYLIYGTSRYGDKRDYVGASLKAQRDYNNSRIMAIKDVQDKTLEELKKRLSIDNENNNSDEERIRTRNLQIIGELEPNKYMYAILEYITNGRVNFSQNKDLGAEGIVLINQLREKRNKIYEIIYDINRGRYSAGAEEAIKRVNKLYNEFYSLAGKAVQKSGLRSNSKFVIGNDVMNKNLLNAMKNVLYNLQSSTINAEVNGHFGEDFVRSCGDDVLLAEYETAKEILDSFKVSNLGGHGTSFQVTQAQLDPKIAAEMNKLKQSKNNKVTTDIYGDIYQVHTSPDKVDATISVNGDPLNISAKAYNLTGSDSRNGYATVQDEVNLYYNLLGTAENFANHWINMHAFFQTRNLEMETELKRHIAYEGLVAGNSLKRNSALADTFVYIDLHSGKVRVASTKKMMETLEGFKFEQDPSNINLFPQNRIGWRYGVTIEQRIANVLFKLKSTTIKVSYKISTI